MEFDERKNKPDSTRKFLQKQVEEQSEVCDITVKMGHWERKYHRCVLAASPFFECVLKNDFLEKNTGTINVTLGTPTNVDMALMFLYGKKPKLNDTNIGVMIELAEFFLIPNLKSDCVSWLKKQSITDANCISLLQLSSKYEFELPKCTEHIESNLNSILEQQSSVFLTYESIHYLFTNKKLRYLQMEDRLRFLIRWYETQPQSRTEMVKTLLETVDYDDIPISTLNEIKQDQVAENLLNFVNGGMDDNDVLTEVLLDAFHDSFLCYDLARDLWYKIARTSNDEYTLPENITDTDAHHSELFLTRHNYQGDKLFKVSLATNEIQSYDVVSDTGNNIERSNVFHFGNNVCVICKSEQVKLKSSNHTNISINDRLRVLSLFGPINEANVLTYAHLLHNDTSVYKKTTTVFIGSIIGEMVRVTPQFSVVDCEIESVAVNKNSIIALIPSSRTCVLVYDSVNCTLDKIESQTEYGDKIFPAENGFVIHNNKRCKTIVRMSGPALSVRFAVNEFILSDKRYSQAQYYICNNTWFRYFRESYDSDYRFQCVDQSKLEETLSPSDIEWNELSLPKEKSACTSSTLGKTMHVVRLPRRLLRCHVECPHCVAEKQKYNVVRSSRYYDDDTDYYYDSSDSEDNLVYLGGYDSSDYYYYSSD